MDGNAKMATLEPFIRDCEVTYIIPLIGPDLYNELNSAYNASLLPGGAALSPALTELLPYVQRPLAHYVVYTALPQLAVTFGEMGIRQHRADESDPAPRWLIEKLQFNAIKSADTSADQLLSFLEENAAAGVYNSWFASDYNTKNSGFIVFSTAIASKYLDINNSRRMFLKLRGKMREIETRMIPKLISQPQYDALTAALRANNLTAAQSALIEKLEPIICKRALYMQFQFLRVQITDNGLFIYSGTDDLYKLGQLATDADIKILKTQLMGGSLGEMGYLNDEEELKSFINTNIANYPLIEQSTVYTIKRDPGPTWAPKNSADDKFYAV